MTWWKRGGGGSGSGEDRPTGEGTSFGGGWRRTGGSDWKKAQEENDLLRQVRKAEHKRPPKGKGTGSAERAKAQKKLKDKDQSKAIFGGGQIREQKRSSAPGRPMPKAPKPRSGGGSPLGKGKGHHPGKTGGSPLSGRGGGSSKSPLSGGGGSKSSSSGNRSKGSPRGKRLY